MFLFESMFELCDDGEMKRLAICIDANEYEQHRLEMYREDSYAWQYG